MMDHVYSEIKGLKVALPDTLNCDEEIVLLAAPYKLITAVGSAEPGAVMVRAKLIENGFVFTSEDGPVSYEELRTILKG